MQNAKKQMKLVSSLLRQRSKFYPCHNCFIPPMHPLNLPPCFHNNTSHREAESSRKLAEDLRQKSEKIEMEAATAASMQQQTGPNHSNGYDSYGGLMGGAQNQGGYSNPFAMG